MSLGRYINFLDQAKNIAVGFRSRRRFFRLDSCLVDPVERWTMGTYMNLLALCVEGGCEKRWVLTFWEVAVFTKCDSKQATSIPKVNYCLR